MSTELASQPVWFDSHCHLHDEPDPEDVFARAREHGVGRVVLIGTDPDSSTRAVSTARLLGAAASATVGLHPHEASLGTAFLAELLEESAGGVGTTSFAPVVAIGECGLDYFYEHSPRDAQRIAFAEQIELAKSFGLTLVIHTRDAWDDTLSMLREEGAPERTIIHCFTGGVEEARACLDLGAYLSFSGILTFKNADDVRAAASFCPIDRLLVETDAPYLAPVPHRGQRNEPAYVALVGEALAVLRDVPVAELAAATRENTLQAFKLAA